MLRVWVRRVEWAWSSGYWGAGGGRWRVESESESEGEKKEKFIKRNCFRSLVQHRLKKPDHLWTNYSSHAVTPAQAKYLDLGLIFVTLPKKFNMTEVDASLMQWERSMRWREFWYKKEHDSGDDCDESEQEYDVRGNIFKSKEKKTKLPRKHSTPAALLACLALRRMKW